MRWDIEVFGGVQPPPEVQVIAPVAFGTPTIILGQESDGVRHPLVYQGVLLETRSPGSISMFGPKLPDGSTPSIHVMENVWHVYFSTSSLEIEGVERRDDGVVIHSRWEATPSGPTPEDEALMREVFGE